MPSTAALARWAGVEVARVSPCSDPVASGRFGVRSPSRYGTQTSPRLRRGRERQLAQTVEVHAQQPGGGVEHPGRVERAHQGQEPPGGVGEPGHGPGRVRARALRHRERRPGRPDRDHHVPGPGPDPEGGGHVVPGAGREPRVRTGVAGEADLARAVPGSSTLGSCGTEPKAAWSRSVR
nr:hypothetical protein GCM10020093_078880 [Planobispora longispora]